MKKIIVRSLIALLVVLALALVGGYWYLDTITGEAVEQGAAYATGTKTTVAAAQVDLMGGRLGVSGVTVDNPKLPEGGSFDSPWFLKLGQARFAVQWNTVLAKTIRLPEVTFENLKLHLERKSGTSNHEIIRSRIKELMGPEKKRPEDARQYMIDKIRIEDVTIVLHGYPGGKRTLNLSEPIELNDIGTDTAKGVVAAEVTSLIVEAVFRSMIKDVANLPKMLVNDVGDVLKNLENIDEFGKKLFESTGELLPDFGNDKDKKDGEEGSLKDAAGDIKKGIDRLLGGDDKSESEGEKQQ